MQSASFVAGSYGMLFFALCVPASADADTTATRERPNILLILSDDMGYSDIGVFGGEISTPNLNRLAERGIQFTQFYNTARCCPTRASLLTGLYPHQAGIGHLIHKTPHAGYSDYLVPDSITLSEILQAAGYGTYMSGKWHLAPRSYRPKTDVEHWPTRRGFDAFYGTICGSGSFFDPRTLCRGETLITPVNDPEYQPDSYYYTDAITENAIQFLRRHGASFSDKPFFLYMAYTAAHWPLHAPPDAIRPYHGKYDRGYAAIHARRLQRLKELDLIPEVGDVADPVGNWSEVQHPSIEADLMETYAAMVTRMDEGIGKVVAYLRDSGEFENTLILYLQDNGGCAEDWFSDPTDYAQPFAPMDPDTLQKRSQPPMQTRDGRPVRTGPDVKPGPADSYTAYKENWANVSNTPFRKYKHYVHEGGISTPCIAHWPAGIQPVSLPCRIREPAHLIDILPTCVELAGAFYPESRKGVKLQALPGISLVPVFRGTGMPERKEPLFWEHESNRAVRFGKWKLVALADAPWELYDMSRDRGEMKDLAASYPDLVADLAARWDAWAARSRVLPLGGWRDRIRKR